MAADKGPYKDFEHLFEEGDGNKAALEMLRKEIETLKRRNTSLTRRVRELEDLGFQEQLNVFNETVKSIGQRVTEIGRFAASVEVNALLGEILRWVGDNLSDDLEMEVREYIMRLQASTLQAIELTPIQATSIAEEFRTKLTTYFRAKGFKAFFED